jgi:hypothetical protein
MKGDKLPFMINPVKTPSRKGARPHKTGGQMAKRKRRKLYGAALKAHQKKIGKKSNPHKKRRKARKSYRKHANRQKHVVKSHSRKGGAVSAYRRKGARVKQHMSNPFGGAAGQAGYAIAEGVFAAVVILGAVMATGLIVRQAEKLPYASSGWGNVAAKAGVALGLTWVLYKATKNMGPRWKGAGQIASAAAYIPASLALLGHLAPALAAQVSLSEGMDAALQMEPAYNRNSDQLLNATIDAQLQMAAESDRLGMERESESGAY